MLAVAAASTPSWSTPAPLAPCSAVPGTPQVVFPRDGPSNATGPGAIVWDAGPRCPGGQGARVAPIDPQDMPGASLAPLGPSSRALALRGPLLAAAAPHGQIAIYGHSPTLPTGDLLIQGAAGGPFAELSPAGGSTSPAALTTAYLGDLALASPPAPTAPAAPTTNTGARMPAGSGLRVHIERFFAHSFTRNVSLASAGSSPVRTLTLALDYRSEALAVWTHTGELYAQLLPNHGRPRAIQPLARVGPGAHVTALLSDDEHGIVSWAQQQDGETSVYLDRSAPGVRFTAPLLLERFTDPAAVSAPAASPELVRLSSESVLLAWAGVSEGRWVVRVAPVDLDGTPAPSTIAAPAGDALLAELTPGPRDDALVLWTEPQPSGNGDGNELSAAGASAGVERQTLLATRAFDSQQGQTTLGEVEPIATAVEAGEASAAIDPSSDRAVAVWRDEAGSIEYSLSGESQGP